MGNVFGVSRCGISLRRDPYRRQLLRCLLFGGTCPQPVVDLLGSRFGIPKTKLGVAGTTVKSSGIPEFPTNCDRRFFAVDGSVVINRCRSASDMRKPGKPWWIHRIISRYCGNAIAVAWDTAHLKG